MGEKKTKKVYVVGHKNPDTDSICSAIAYANLKRILTGEKYVAKRAGDLNGETRYVLERFGVEVPGYLDNVRLQVQDMNITDTPGIDGNMSIKDAWEAMKELKTKTLPILRDEKLEGLISTGDIAKSYMEVHESDTLSIAKTQYKNIVATLDGTLILGDPEAQFDHGKVVIAVLSPDLMEDYIEKDDLVICGNRYESQLCAIEMEAKCLVICQTEVSRTIQKLAEERGTTIILTPYEPFTVARLINQSVPVSFFMTKGDLETFRLTDFVEDIREDMTKKKFRDFPVTDKQGKFCGFISRTRLLTSHKKQVILVDHNEISQAVPGIEEADILEIIDHHRLGSLETVGPVYFRNQPVGCTATIIYELYTEKGVEVDPVIAGLLCSAIISDTLLFRSPTCTPQDQRAAEHLAKIAGIDMDSYAKEMFNAGSDIQDKTAEEICFQDYKIFNIGDKIIGVGQINSMNQGELEMAKEKLAGYLEEAKEKQRLDMVIFGLTNILEQQTEMLYSDEAAREMIIDAFELSKDAEKLILKDVVSRKKQLIPILTEFMQQK